MFKTGIDKKLARLEEEYSKVKALEQHLKILIKDFEAFKKNIEKEVEGNAWIIKEQVKAHEKTRLENEKIFKEINDSFKAANEKHAKFNKQFKDLSQKDEKLSTDLGATKGIITRISKAFNVDTLAQFRHDLGMLADFADSLVKKGEETGKKLSTVDRNISDFKKFSELATTTAKDVSIRYQEVEKYAEDLKALANQYFKKADLIDSKLNATISSISDLGQAVQQINGQLISAQSRLALMDRLKEQLDSQNAMISEIKRRLEYIDQVCSKTVVID